MRYTATAAYPYVNAERARLGLRGQLRALAADDDTVPDWTTMHVTGPVEAVSRHGVVWYEWTAVVDGRGQHSCSE